MRWALSILLVVGCTEADAPHQMTSGAYVRITSPTDADDFHTTMCSSNVSGDTFSSPGWWTDQSPGVSVSWSNSGTGTSGTGMAWWTGLIILKAEFGIGDIPLALGSNRISVDIHDPNGISGSDAITIYRDPSSCGCNRVSCNGTCCAAGERCDSGQCVRPCRRSADCSGTAACCDLTTYVCVTGDAACVCHDGTDCGATGCCAPATPGASVRTCQPSARCCTTSAECTGSCCGGDAAGNHYCVKPCDPANPTCTGANVSCISYTFDTCGSYAYGCGPFMDSSPP